MRQTAGGRQMKSVWNDVRWDEEDSQVILQFPPPGNDEKKFGKHPTQKPLRLIERLVMAASNESDLVLDPFLGSGTTALAAMKLGRKCVGCELDEAYVALSVKKVSTEMATLKSSLLAGIAREKA